MPRSTLTVVAQAVLVSLFIAALATFVGLQKTVVLSIDGKQRTIHTYARSVGDVLRHEHVMVDEHDTVAPALGATVSDGDFVSVHRGRELVLSIDGSTRPVWTTAQDVDEALDQLGLHATNAYVGVSRSGQIPLDGVDVTVRTPHRVTVLVGGRRQVVTTTAATVAELLNTDHVAVGTRDIISPSVAAYPADGQTITVSRVTGRRLVQQVAVPFRTVRHADANMYRGEKLVRHAGAAGLVVRTYDVTYTDGRITAKRLLRSKKKDKPVTRVVVYGTRPVPSGSVSIPSSGGLDWAALAECESGGRPNAVSHNHLYFGLYQFDLSTWHAWGGKGSPADASPAEQTKRARMLYANRGRAPWPICGRFL